MLSDMLMGMTMFSDRKQEVIAVDFLAIMLPTMRNIVRLHLGIWAAQAAGAA